MEISFSQSFLDSLERIDNKVVIDGFSIDSGNIQTSFQVVCHEKKLQVCVEGVSGECGRLDFYCGEESGFTITGEGIAMNLERTIFEFNLPSEPKAIIECPWVTEDTKFLEGIGPDLGNSLYKDIPVSEGSLVWKETIGKYIVDRGIQDNHLYDVELLDTKSGVLEERPIKFKSYQNIVIEQGNFDIEMIKKSVVVKHDVYDDISASSFLVWDSPMIDAKVDLEKEPQCINQIGEYVDPGNVIFGGTDCFQFINYTSSLVGFRVTGTEGSDVEVLFNKKSTSGGYTSFQGTIEEDGSVEIRFSDLPYLHLNGIRAIGPSKVTKIETIMFLEETVDDYSPNPDKTYITKLNNVSCEIEVNGVAGYIEYEKYLGEIKEIGRGVEHINNIPGLKIRTIDDGNLNFVIMDLEKQILVEQNPQLGPTTRYAVFQVSIENNIEVNGNIITTSSLTADYKIKIEQTGIIWKILSHPDYVNEDGHGIFLLGYKSGSTKNIEIITNDLESTGNLEVYQEEAGESIFEFTIIRNPDLRMIDGEWWRAYDVKIRTLSENTGDSWRPKQSNNPYLVTFKFLGIEIPSIGLYAIQLKRINNLIEVWEETIIPGKFTKVESEVTLLNTITKNFIIVKEGTGEEEIGLSWYYYDLSNTNQFYITDTNFQVTNSGPEFLITSDTTLLDLGTGEDRTTFGRVINVNRSDLIGSLGTLVITESPSYPITWRDLIDNNTVNIGVNRELDNIYIRVGEGDDLKDEDYEVSINSIGSFSININSNFKYLIQTFGFIKVFPDEEFSDRSGYELPTKKKVFSNYNYNTTFKFALVELKENMGDSYIEIRGGGILRKVTLKIEGPKKEHDYYYPAEKPNLIRVFENGTISPNLNNTFLYVSSTTPEVNVEGINKYPAETEPIFDSLGYKYHSSKVPISVPNSKTLSYSKYPMKSFGSIKEMSQDYSDSEIITSLNAISYLEYPLYMKGKEHYLWCIDNLGEYSNLVDPTTEDTTFDMVIDAKGLNGKTIYVVSRYSINNKTFITEYPEETDVKIERNELEANILISPQQNVGLDERSQIEYAIPIQVSCNIENNRGNIFLGSLYYKAITKITDDSIGDIIEVGNNTIDDESINGDYIKDYITSDKSQNLYIRLFQLGTDKDIFETYSTIPDLGIWATTNYVIPEIGSDYKITSLDVINSVTSDDTTDVVVVHKEFESNYFLIQVDSLERVRYVEINNKSYYHWYESNNLPMNLISNTSYDLRITVSGLKAGLSFEKTTHHAYKKYGCNYGLYVGEVGKSGEVSGYSGFGEIKEPYNQIKDCDRKRIEVSAEGGSISINAGIFYAVNGIETTEALIVPAEYKFIGENQPLEFSWVNGNLDDEGNLYLVLPPRIRDDDGDKEYILQVTQPHEYYPLNLYITFYQPSLRSGNTPDTNKEKYRIMFLEDEIDVWSNGTVVGTESNEYKVKFVHNLSRDIFEKVYFAWRDTNIPNGSTNTSEDYVYLDDLGLEEIERSFDEKYVMFRFKPNGSQYFIDTDIVSYMPTSGGTSIEIGKVKVKQGYYCLCAEYNQPLSGGSGGTQVQNYLSRKGPKELRLFKHASLPFGGFYEMVAHLPCKSNNDNSKASDVNCLSRGVLTLSAVRKEYNDNEATEYSNSSDVADLINVVELLGMSPNNVFESYGISYVPASIDDYDAKVDPRLNSDKIYITSDDFSDYNPYIEVTYTLKDEYIREYAVFSVSCKITLLELDTGNPCDYYFSLTGSSNKSDEPQDISLLEFSDYNLKYDCNGGIKQVSYCPASFRNMMTLMMIGNPSWIVTTFSEGTNYIVFSASENKSTDSTPAFYRTTQAKIDVKDPRDDYILKSFYIDIEQEPDIQQVSGGEGGDTPTPTPTDVMVSLNFKNDREGPVMINGYIDFYVDDGNNDTVIISTDLPGANVTQNSFVFGAGDTSLSYTVACEGYSSIDPLDYVGNLITEVRIYAYDSDTETQSYGLCAPYSITAGSATFDNNGSYTITFSVSS